MPESTNTDIVLDIKRQINAMIARLNEVYEATAIIHCQSANQCVGTLIGMETQLHHLMMTAKVWQHMPQH